MYPTFRTTVPAFPVSGATLNRLDTLFDRFFSTGGESGSEWTAKRMPVSVWQDDNTLFVEAELPGVLEKDLEITVNDGVLTLKAESRDEEGRAYLYNGRTFGHWERAIKLPESIDAEHVEATLTNGVLRVVLPKHPAARPKKITLKGS